jgi:ParB-like chromosome segregation protein Spo0J
VVHGIHDVHAGWHDMQQPPDAPSDPGTVVPPEVQLALHDAQIRHTHAQAAVHEAKRNDLMHQGAARIATLHQGQQQIALQAQKQQQDAALAQQEMALQRQQMAQQPSGA